LRVKEVRGTEKLAAIRSCLRGDKNALAHLVQRYQAQVLAFCLRITGSCEDAADVAQQVFINAYRRLDQFDQNLPFRAWLMRFAANECTAFLRRRGRPAGGEALEALTDPGQRAPSQVDLAEDREWVRQAVAQLPDQYRTVVLLYYFQELSYTEIAHRTGLSVGSHCDSAIFQLGCNNSTPRKTGPDRQARLSCQPHRPGRHRSRGLGDLAEQRPGVLLRR